MAANVARGHRNVRPALIALCFGLFGWNASAQTTGSVVGNITDQTGAAVVGASLAATNESTGFRRTSISRSDGSYLITLLPLGTYRIQAESVGFKKTIREGVLLTLDENARVDIQLQLGDASQSVKVEARAQEVETEQASLGQLMDQKRITELPLIGRNPQSLIMLIPGAANVNVPTEGTPDVTVNINGGLGLMNSFQLDGVQTNAVQTNLGLPAPPPEMVEEFRAETDAYDASKGRGTTGTFNTITRSGTNIWHGNLFEFHRDNDLTARNFFAIQAPFLVYNQFGGTLGGPVIKNRSWFFFGYQGTRIREKTTWATAIPPTTAEIAGDFSQSGKFPIDPSTGQPFPGGIIPSSRFDPVAVNFLKLLPLPNASNGRDVYDSPQTSYANQYLARFDQQLSHLDLFTARVFIQRSSQTTTWGNLPWTIYATPYQYLNIMAQDTHTFTPSMINEFQMAFNRRIDGRHYSASEPGQTPQALGINLPAEQVPSGFEQVGFPVQMVVSGRFNLKVGGRGTQRLENTWDYRDTFHWIKARHSLKAGFEYQKVDFIGANNLDNGLFGFTGEATGNALADLLIGHAATVALSREQENHHTHLVSGFLQDDYHLSRRVTLNLGLRYEFELPIYQRDGWAATFVPGFQSTRFPNAPVGMAFAGDPGMPDKSIFFPDYNKFGPRIGVAWDVFGDGTTSLRAGWGVFYQINNESTVQFESLNQPFQPSLSLFGVNGLSNPLQNVHLSNVVPGDPIANYNPQTGQAGFTLPVPMYALDPHVRNPYVEQYSLSLQRQLPFNFVLETSYVGNAARKLLAVAEGNQAVCTASFVSTFGACTQANRQARRLYDPAGLGAITQYRGLANSEYNALQVVARRRFAQNYLVNVTYTWSHAIDDLGPFQNPLNMAASRASSTIDRRNIFAASWVWQIPWLSQSRFSLAKHILGGWELTGLVRLTSGSPFTVLSGIDNSLSLVNNDHPNVIGNPFLPTDRPRSQLIAQYFNPAAFQQNAQVTFGNAGNNILVGPGYADVDSGLMKNFLLTERHKLQFRAEFFNLLNRPNFANPVNALNSPVVGQITSALDGRRIQLGLKYSF